MSEIATTEVHETSVVPHDYVNCHTAKNSDGCDCMTRFEARCSCGWVQGAGTSEIADGLVLKHVASKWSGT